MPRFYAKISKDEFLSKIQEFMSPLESEDDDDDDDGYPYNLPKKIAKDLSKVEFDFENSSMFDENRENILEGYREIVPGFHVFFAWAGGDWQIPVTWIYYFDGKDIRAYIPSDGNQWDKKEKRAYDGDEDHEEIDREKIYADILNRIKLKK